MTHQNSAVVDTNSFNAMYLFSAIKDAFFTGRRSSVGSESGRFSENPPLRRSSSEAHFLQRESIGADRDGPIGMKAKRHDADRLQAADKEPKRRRTLGGVDRELGLTSLSSVSDVQMTSSRSRQPSPIPRHSMPGPAFSRRSSLIGSPLPVAPLNRVPGSPRASPRPETPSHPKFVDLLRRDPTQQRALDSARSILETLDRVTTSTAPVGGSARKYRPPQPLRPMRFKSLSSSRTVSLHDMLSGAVSSVPPSPQAPAIQRLSPISIPAAQPTAVTAVVGSPRHGLTLPLGATTNASAFAGSPRHAIGLGQAPSPKRALNVPVPESPKRVLLSQPAVGQMSPLKRQPSPLKKPVASAPVPPPAGTFIWGDPKKVSNADFIEDDGFAPGADESGSDESQAGSPKKGPADVSSIFGGPSTTQRPSSLFGDAGKKSEVSSIFGSQPGTSGGIFGVPAETKKPEMSIFGSTEPKKSEPTSLYGATASTEPKKVEITGLFGAAVEPKKPDTPSIFGTSVPAEAKKPDMANLFGSITGGTKQPEPASLFGSTNNPEPGKTVIPSLFGAGPHTEAKKPEVSSIFGFAPPGEQKKPEVSSLFGAPADKKPEPSQPEKKAEPASIFGSASTGEPKPSLFGQSATPAGASLFGAPVEKKQEPSGLFGSVGGVSTDTVTFGGLASEDKSKSLPSSFAGTGIFSAPSSETPKAAGMFVFGATPPASPGGGALPSQPSLFGSTASQPQQQSIFGRQTAPSGSIFGAATQAAPAGASMFGAQPAQQPSIFGSAAPQPLTSGPFMGSASQPGTPSNSLFGAAPAAPTPSGNSIFGNQGGMFGEQSSSAFSFGASAGTPTSNSFGGASFDNPFAAGAGDFNQAAPKRKILKASRRT